MTTMSVLDAAGRSRSPATMPGYHAGRRPRNKGIRYRPTRPRSTRSWRSGVTPPMTVTAGAVRAMIVVLWRAGLRIQEALALAEHDLDQRRGSVLVRQGRAASRGRHG